MYTAIRPCGETAVYTENGKDVPLPYDSVASMNCWGFTPDIFEEVNKGFEKFLASPDGDPKKREFYLPYAVADMMKNGKCTVKVYESLDSWYGVTYHEDREAVCSSIRKLRDDGVYPKTLG